MKVKTNASNKKICWIISAVLVGIYMIFGTLMVVNMIENNSKVSDYGLYVDEYMASYFSYKYNGNLNVSRYEIIEFLENIKKEYTLRGTENHFNNYNYIDVDLEIKTADYNYSNKCSADDAMTVLLTQINEKLNNKIYYMKVITNEKFITGIIISDERIR